MSETFELALLFFVYPGFLSNLWEFVALEDGLIPVTFLYGTVAVDLLSSPMKLVVHKVADEYLSVSVYESPPSVPFIVLPLTFVHITLTIEPPYSLFLVFEVDLAVVVWFEFYHHKLRIERNCHAIDEILQIKRLHLLPSVVCGVLTEIFRF